MAARKAARPPSPRRRPASAAPKGHRPTPVTKAIVARAVEANLPDEEIAALLALKVGDLRAAYRTELDRPQGRPAHEPTQSTRVLVERAAAIPRVTHDDIAALLGISDETLRKHYPDELRNARLKTTVQVAQSFLENCIGTKGRAATFGPGGQVVTPAIPSRPGDVNAQKFYLERFADLVQQTNVRLPFGGGDDEDGKSDEHRGGFEIRLVPAKDGRRA